MNSDYNAINRLQSASFKIWRDNVILDMMTYSERSFDQNGNRIEQGNADEPADDELAG